jgi:hypothetical protein
MDFPRSDFPSGPLQLSQPLAALPEDFAEMLRRKGLHPMLNTPQTGVKQTAVLQTQAAPLQTQATTILAM